MDGVRSVMRKNKKNYVVLTITLIVVLILFPIFIDHLIIGNKIVSNISNSEWVSFLGSYTGAIISGLISIIGVFLTIQYYKNQDVVNREVQSELAKEAIKKQYEIKYKFEFLEELELATRNMNNIYESFQTITLLSKYDDNKDCLGKIDNSIWKSYQELSKSLSSNIINLKSIYNGKLKVFYQTDFFEAIEEDIEALTTMLYYAVDKNAKRKNIDQLYTSIDDILMQWRLSRTIKNINDLDKWINDIKVKFEEFMENFKEEIKKL